MFLLSLRFVSCYLTRPQNCSPCCLGHLEPHPCACWANVLRQELRVTLSRRVWLRCLTRQHGEGAEMPCPVKCLPATLIIKCFMSTPQHVRPVTRDSDHHTLSPLESLSLCNSLFHNALYTTRSFLRLPGPPQSNEAPASLAQSIVNVLRVSQKDSRRQRKKPGKNIKVFFRGVGFTL